jgi:hypothetical protein
MSVQQSVNHVRSVYHGSCLTRDCCCPGKLRGEAWWRLGVVIASFRQQNRNPLDRASTSGFPLLPDRVSWPRVFVEAVVIVGSILLAFGMQAWWDARQEEVLIRQGLGSILEELDAIEAQLAEALPVDEMFLSRADTLQELLASVAVDQALTVRDTLLSSLFWDYVMDVPTGMVESFIASGRLDAVESPDLQRVLLEWVALLEDQRDDQARASEFGGRELQPYLRAEFDVQNPQWVEFDLMDPAASTQIRATAHLRNLVGWQRRWLLRMRNQDADLVEARAHLESLVREERTYH